jgi:TetR/AcrR family transcriptional repressor of nem operon
MSSGASRIKVHPVKVTRQQAEKNRQRIVDVAARMFREHGFAGIGVAELMKQAGFTHGGFYGQFASKADLMAQACAQAFADKVSLWHEARELDVDRPLASAAQYFLTAAHRDDPGTGCPTANRQRALCAWSTLVGAMILARAVDDPDFSDEILQAVSESICNR